MNIFNNSIILLYKYFKDILLSGILKFSIHPLRDNKTNEMNFFSLSLEQNHRQNISMTRHHLSSYLFNPLPPIIINLVRATFNVNDDILSRSFFIYFFHLHIIQIFFQSALPSCSTMAIVKLICIIPYPMV